MEVILVCKNDSFKDKGHFDVKQANTILWKKSEDITDLLKKRIEATIFN